MIHEHTSHVFGPVPSRRLGRSLGVDVVPFKTCTYDCIYCQLGRTSQRTAERREWVSLEAVLADLETKLETEPDYITISGSGEPTLYSRLEELIRGIKERTGIPIAVLTNGSLLHDPAVRRSLLEADLVVPSLDAGDAALFSVVNRPAGAISFQTMVEGLVALRREFQGQYWLEVFLLGGVTAMDEEVEKIAAIARRIDPDRIHLNTVTRPPSEDFAYGVPKQEMERLARFFGPRAEVIANYSWVPSEQPGPISNDSIAEMLRRRPCTIEDIAAGLKISREEAVRRVEDLKRSGKVVLQRVGGRIFCVISKTPTA